MVDTLILDILLMVILVFRGRLHRPLVDRLSISGIPYNLDRYRHHSMSTDCQPPIHNIQGRIRISF